MKRFAAALSFLVGICATWAGVFGAGPLPPLGKALSPSEGLWVNALNDLPRDASGTIESLDAAVGVVYDQRSVPHIFASSELDAYRALGYVVARDRLFQLELQSRAGEGTLTELVGSAALSMDKETRQLGMPRAARLRMAALDKNGRLMQILNAYSDGINAYRRTLSQAQYPAEYKLLNKAPREWLPEYSLHLFNRMGYTLAYSPTELTLLRARALVGDSAARALFDTDSPVQEPIQPSHRSEPRSLALHIPAPGQPDTAAARALAAMGGGSRSLFGWSRVEGMTQAERDELESQFAFASNNWAVSPTRSATGNALLAGDPHLELTLPSIWYEAHMVVPGVMDAGGVTIPGMPGVVIGYTRALAWSFTNTGADVMDFWREKVDDVNHPTRYELDGELVPLTDIRVEEYRDNRGKVIDVDTVYYTHRGPMEKVGNEWLSMRWTVLEAGDELLAFPAAQHAQTATAFLDSMAIHFHAPAQNIIVADTAGSIAIRSTGRFPIRADSSRGNDIFQGNTRSTDWIGYRPVERYPQGLNPSQGYLASANQQPIDPLDDHLYFGVDGQYEIWRALQINRLLRADSAITRSRMREFQTAPGSVRADDFAPAFVIAAKARIAAGDTSRSLAAASELLASWDRQYTRNNTGAKLFETALSMAGVLLYDEFVPTGASRPSPMPSESRLLQLVRDSTNAWWDRIDTRDVKEDRDMILSRALAGAYDSLVVEYGDPKAHPWVWGSVSPARPTHLLKLAGFNAPETPIDGGRGTLNPSVASKRANFGASWRMVVEFGKSPVVNATYPGGQSGNPASQRYLDRLPQWASGTLDSVRIPKVASDIEASDVRATLRLSKQ